MTAHHTFCPVEALALQLAAAKKERDLMEGAASDRLGANDHGPQLEVMDLEDDLEARASWLTPESARGATLTALLLLRAQREAESELRDPGGQHADRWSRKARRLGDRLIEYLEAAAGATVAEQGLADWHLVRTKQRQVRDRLVA